MYYTYNTWFYGGNSGNVRLNTMGLAICHGLFNITNGIFLIYIYNDISSTSLFSQFYYPLMVTAVNGIISISFHGTLVTECCDPIVNCIVICVKCCGGSIGIIYGKCVDCCGWIKNDCFEQTKFVYEKVREKVSGSGRNNDETDLIEEEMGDDSD